MPYVNIKITKEGATTAQKAELIDSVTDLLVRVLGKNPETTVVVIDEVDTDNWGSAGKALPSDVLRGSDYRKSVRIGYVPPITNIWQLTDQISLFKCFRFFFSVKCFHQFQGELQ